MSRYIINGGNKIEGTLKIRGAKNAILPIMAASILNENVSIIHNVPFIADVLVMIKILESIGCKIEYSEDTLIIDSSNINFHKINEEYVRKMRSSIIIMGAMIGRLEHIEISHPGGCAIGQRPIDLHLKALRALNVNIEESNGVISCYRECLKGNIINFEKRSVGATENAMLAAARATGTTKIYNPAKEPEIEDLQNFLNAMGAKVSGAGTDYIEIEGVKNLGRVEYSVIPDRIAIGTYMVASAITGGRLEVENAIKAHMEPISNVLRGAGCEIEYTKSGLIMVAPKVIKAVDLIKTSPHPGFPTDMQSQMMALMTLSDGITVFFETIFENRFMHCSELKKMGADITLVNANICKVRGVNQLYGNKVKSTDLRGGASLIIAALAANGESEIDNIYHIERGYENIEKVLRDLGADIRKI
ncbi:MULTISPECIES: UDP-N-acetylglucosamine 1-carboxyvinyltransferase [unclassified Romboutsia]|uniref:UDP-N-acetylglucosamine 1-carboxyvinyltransferase n=1 Tax=unclassified Romboutsia TaxID=2626894 RepID=UPI0008209551|nr:MULTISPECIES: UDP-N-acetylglucosamine 1-carboxyvinyltransferase [unclassified Romboutsia]SCH15556.1 UDP-N-acetylglucosamine 1-carboxyvinyltransferase 1 [uncultured Clostridium sp.]